MQLPGWPVRTWENMLVITWDLGADDLWCAADIKIVKSFAVRIHPPSFGPWPVFWFFLFLLFDLCLFMLSCMDCWWKINGDGHANLPQHQALQILGGNSLCITTVERSQNAAASATSTPGLKKNKRSSAIERSWALASVPNHAGRAAAEAGLLPMRLLRFFLFYIF